MRSVWQCDTYADNYQFCRFILLFRRVIEILERLTHAQNATLFIVNIFWVNKNTELPKANNTFSELPHTPNEHEICIWSNGFRVHRFRW